MTSVKEFRVAEPATAESLGRGRFVFTDAYSVFDWGRMPDPIPRKGASLCTMGAYNFERLEEAGVPTHYRGVVDPNRAGEPTAEPNAAEPDADEPIPDDAIVGLDAVSTPPTEMVIELTQVPELPYLGDGDGYDYDAYHASAAENYLIPLEVVFRNTVPIGSSLRDRREPSDVGLDASEWPETVVDLPEPVVEFSTKYEEQDRYLTREEATRIAGAASIEDLEATALAVNRVVTDRANAAGFDHEDGKIECLYLDGEIRVADVVGTFDENRFAYDGQEVSKEVVRQWYKRNDSEWVAAVSEAKQAVADRSVADWRTICDDEPVPLPDRVIEAVSAMYAAGANAYTGVDLFDAPAIEEAVDDVREL
ncbi:phosphoribosylaminoimidazole-succinocarboxamide synthase [Halopenitus malekzadehii]|uniref:Phosphoribosylaminoimidazole-succinocarboxamide synthase n=1 Tax=Halopenitus malekzadehii TaxID=1267564 RepID=A0A1H6IY71_9EURY|nr:phosphoribosylaminoimidazolesuccinocarboxamide synthase [Halopenitus malekzadehii]SEH52692.1 phosphoribosylaminoimidazole-succinocarboxamide synthase [Halopenitus malekzadehii]